MSFTNTEAHHHNLRQLSNRQGHIVRGTVVGHVGSGTRVVVHAVETWFPQHIETSDGFVDVKIVKVDLETGVVTLTLLRGQLVCGVIQSVDSNGAVVSLSDGRRGRLRWEQPVSRVFSLSAQQEPVVLPGQLAAFQTDGEDFRGVLRLLRRKVSVSDYVSGMQVSALVLRSDTNTGSYVLQLPGNVPAFLSFYEVAEELKPGTICTATIERATPGFNGAYAHVVLTKSSLPIAY